MDTTPFVDYAWLLPRFSEMRNAISDGFIHSFVQTEDGMYQCLSFPENKYKKEECKEEIVHSRHESVTLHLITTRDGIKGTMHRYYSQY